MRVRGLQWPAPMSQRTCDIGGREIHKKGDKPGHCASFGKECKKKHRVTETVEFLHSKPPGVPVETRWCVGALP